MRAGIDCYMSIYIPHWLDSKIVFPLTFCRDTSIYIPHWLDSKEYCGDFFGSIYWIYIPHWLDSKATGEYIKVGDYIYLHSTLVRF